VTMEQREEVGTRDKAQTIPLISRGQGTVEYQAREFCWERSQGFARTRVPRTVEKTSIKKVSEESILERRKIGLAVFDHMLNVLPLHLLKALMQGSRSSLRVLPGSLASW